MASKNMENCQLKLPHQNISTQKKHAAGLFYIRISTRSMLTEKMYLSISLPHT